MDPLRRGELGRLKEVTEVLPPPAVTSSLMSVRSEVDLRHRVVLVAVLTGLVLLSDSLTLVLEA